MKSDTPLDFAAFQLSPKRSRCELFVSSNGNTEKLASGLVKPFVTHLKVAEEQVALAMQSIKLEVERHKNVESWFTKGTLERFVRFVSTPEVLELVSTFDAEMSQLEAARRIYSQGASEQISSTMGGGRSSFAAGADATKKELLRAIDVRLTAVKQDLTAACARAAAAGFNHDTVSDLQLFAERFGAARLNEACSKFVSLYDRRPDLFENPSWKSASGDQAIRASYSSDMSIDDDLPTSTATEQTSSAAPDQSGKPHITSQPPKCLSSSDSFPLRRSTGKDDTEIDKKEEASGGRAEEPFAQTAPQPASRRLSVQDRINLFENKQKEVGGSGGASGGKPVVAKPELRRLSSDVSHTHTAATPAVLRRWSGASDMSIDLGGDKKETEGPLCTPYLSSFPKSEDRKLPMNNTHASASANVEVQKDQTNLKDQAIGGSGSEEVVPTKVGTSSGTQLTVSSSVKSEESVGSNQLASTLEKTQSWSSLSKSEGDSTEVPVPVLAKPHAHIKSFHSGKEERFGVSGQVKFNPSTVETSDQRTDAGSIEDSDPEPTSRAPSKKTAFAGSKIQEAFAASQQRGLDIGSLLSQARGNSSAENAEVEKKDPASIEKQFGESEQQKLKFQKQVQRDKSTYVCGYNNTPPSGKFVQDGSGCMPLEAPLEQSQRARKLKGNQELNDELKMKANELEKLFAEHKLRVPGDQPNSTRRSKPSDVDADQAMSLPHQIQNTDPVPTQILEQKTASESLVTGRIDGHNYTDALQRSFSEIGFSDDSRGKFYDSYVKKRDARLRELWGSNRAEKEARMKAMHDSLERSTAEMKAKLSWSGDRQDPVSTARRRAERLRSFNARSSMKREQPLDFGQLEDEDLSEFPDVKPFGNGVSRNVQGKKPLPIKNSSTSTPRTPAVSIPRSATKVSSSSGRRRTQSDNPLAQSVPNFSDLKKENTKPYSAASKAAARSQLRNYTRSRSTNEEMPSVKEEKPRRSQSLRKNSPTPESSEGVILTPLKLDKEQGEGVYTKFSKNVEPKPFLRKNNSAKMKALIASEAMTDEEYDKAVVEPNVIKDNDEEEFDTMKTEDLAVVDGAGSRMSQESERLMNSESENGDASQSFTKVDSSLAAELPSTVTSTFPVQDSPGESPMSWNSRTHHPFSYTQEASDVDASADSPMGSPASWNLQGLNPTEADAARMRKKWGSAQKPILVSSGAHSRKDMTKGFKRLLKFGRKSRGTESLADWISATTSDGDDDTEDGRDSANRLSEDLRKSRMGSSQGLPSEDSFNESDFFGDQVHTLQSSIPAPPANFRLREDHLSGSSIKAPRSFFSLSSFRSKGSDSKPR